MNLKHRICGVLAGALCLMLLTGCGGEEKKPDEIAITLDGERVESLDLLNGEDLTGIGVEITPEGYEGEVVWSSDDPGVVKVTADGENCSITAKKTGSAKLVVECDGFSHSIWVHVEKNPENLTDMETGIYVNDTKYALEWCNLYFANMYYTIITDYGSSVSNYGLDTSLGINSLEEQSCDYSSDGTWYGYFLEYSTYQMLQIQALVDYADENSIVLDDDELALVDEQLSELPTRAEEAGCESVDDFLTTYFGEGVTQDMYREFLICNSLSDKAYNTYSESLSYSDEELAEYYATLGYEEGENDYRLTSMRHILIMAEADESGSYTDEAIAAAHEEAERIYEEWKAGDMTEDSFAQLAEEYTDDTGSAENGGFYGDIYQGEMIEGIDTWLFAEGRKEGDTVVVDNNGSYTGTHIVYFTGYGDVYSNYLAEEELRGSDVTAWFEELTGQYTLTQGGAYSQIGKL